MLDTNMKKSEEDIYVLHKNYETGNTLKKIIKQLMNLKILIVPKSQYVLRLSTLLQLHSRKQFPAPRRRCTR